MSLKHCIENDVFQSKVTTYFGIFYFGFNLFDSFSNGEFSNNSLFYKHVLYQYVINLAFIDVYNYFLSNPILPSITQISQIAYCPRTPFQWSCMVEHCIIGIICVQQGSGNYRYSKFHCNRTLNLTY